MADELPGDNRPPVYFDDAADSWVIRASAGGGCLFELAAHGQGYEPLAVPPFLARAFQEGHDREPMALAHIERSGWTLHSRQAEANLVVRSPGNKPGVMVRCHPDALGEPPGRNSTTHIVEVKWLSDDNWRKALRYGVGSVVRHYNWQASVMMHVYGMPLMWAFGNKGHAPDDDGVKAYCEDEGEIRYEFLDEAPVSLKEIQDRAEEIVSVVTGDDLLESGRGCDSPTHFPCLFRHLVADKGDEGEPDSARPTVLVLSDDDAETWNRVFQERQTFKGQMDEAKKRYEEANRVLLALAGGPDTLFKKVRTEKWEVSILDGRGNGRYVESDMPTELRAKIKQYWRRGKAYKYFRNAKRMD